MSPPRESVDRRKLLISMKMRNQPWGDIGSESVAAAVHCDDNPTHRGPARDISSTSRRHRPVATALARLARPTDAPRGRRHRPMLRPNAGARDGCRPAARGPAPWLWALARPPPGSPSVSGPRRGGMSWLRCASRCHRKWLRGWPRLLLLSASSPSRHLQGTGADPAHAAANHPPTSSIAGARAAAATTATGCVRAGRTLRTTAANTLRTSRLRTR